MTTVLFAFWEGEQANLEDDFSDGEGLGYATTTFEASSTNPDVDILPQPFERIFCATVGGAIDWLVDFFSDSDPNLCTISDVFGEDTGITRFLTTFSDGAAQFFGVALLIMAFQAPGAPLWAAFLLSTVIDGWVIYEVANFARGRAS